MDPVPCPCECLEKIPVPGCRHGSGNYHRRSDLRDVYSGKDCGKYFCFLCQGACFPYNINHPFPFLVFPPEDEIRFPLFFPHEENSVVVWKGTRFYDFRVPDGYPPCILKFDDVLESRSQAYRFSKRRGRENELP